MRLLKEYGKSNVTDKLLIQGVMRNYAPKSPTGSALKQSKINLNVPSSTDRKRIKSSRKKTFQLSPVR